MPYSTIASRVAAVLILSAAVYAQQAPAASPAGDTPAPSSSTIRGCLQGERGNYIVIKNTGSVYVLKGVGNSLDKFLRHEVEVKGQVLPGTVKTGVRAEKAGSNPSDTVRGTSGVPFQVGDVQADVREVSKKCKAGDQE